MMQASDILDSSPAEQPVEQPAEQEVPTAAISGVIDTVTRLAGLLEQETAALHAQQATELGDISDRKNQMLLELSRISQGLDGAEPDPALRAALEKLRSRLDENLSTLELHITTVRDVAHILSTAIREAESDGTYSARSGPRGNE